MRLAAIDFDSGFTFGEWIFSLREGDRVRVRLEPQDR